MIFYFARLLMMMSENLDLVGVATVGLGLNFITGRKRPIWHVYQVGVMAVMTKGVYW